ncbi:MAG: UPF0755 protein [Parcubacteria group bacterium Gr01-1014_48]|nr:MAG: UPF0755 protein [Parcubacteria group bacterium Gr01-1014_48]
MSLADDLVRKGVLKSAHIIQAFRDIRRADFMPEDERAFSEIDEAFPIGEGQTISQPYTVAFMLELLHPNVGQNILDVGFGSGWQTALLAHIVSENKKKPGRVFAIERIRALYNFGKKNIAKYSFIANGVVKTYCRNAVLELDNVSESAGGFHGIIAAASAPMQVGEAESSIPRAWKKHLKIGGKIVMPIGESLWVFTKKKGNSFEKKEYPGFLFVPLVAEPKKEINWRKLIVGAGILLLASICARVSFSFSPPPNGTFPKEVTIPRASSAREVSELLEREGIIRSPFMLLVSLFMSGDEGRVQAGTYFFEKPTWLHIVAEQITNPATKKIVTIRIPEGVSLRGIAAEYESRGIFEPAGFWAFTGEPAKDYRSDPSALPDFSDLKRQFAFLADVPSHATLEGFLLPDTYELFDDVTPAEVVYKMLQNFEEKMKKENLFEEIIKRELSLYEVLTMASLLEREAIYYDDKRIIAGIAENRIRLDMPLQIDASLMYVTGRGSLLLTKDDLDSDSPYNTYKHKGLPLGPIANPGIESIKAVLHPEKTSYLYYVSDRHYTIHYSSTFEEHKSKKQMYVW